MHTIIMNKDMNEYVWTSAYNFVLARSFIPLAYASGQLDVYISAERGERVILYKR